MSRPDARPTPGDAAPVRRRPPHDPPGDDLGDARADERVGAGADPTNATTATTATTEGSTTWRRAVGVGLVAYAVSRLCVLSGAAVRAMQVTVDRREDGEVAQGAVEIMTGVFTQWDGAWYLELARRGYPESVPADITFNQLEARAAFFPLFPSAVRVVDAVLPGGDTMAALGLNLVLGAVSVVLVGLLAARVFDDAVAARAMVLYAVFPGSFVLSFAYSEALFVVLAAACLLFLLDERWLLAGLAAALATATRPNGVAIAVACLVAAIVAIRRRRDWSSLVAVALAPLGFVLFQLDVDRIAGERGIWFRVQTEAWSEGTSYGMTAIGNSVGFLTSPFDSPADALTVLSLVALAIMVVAAVRRPLPWPWVAFSAVVVVLMLLPETVTARPRFVFTAFPLFIAVAAWWPRPRVGTDGVGWARTSWDLVLVMCGAGLVVLTSAYAVFAAIP
ncbi:glycosyltransferase family 39 protein [Ilumatobacter sp.]|uniref:glycosyltransferase family 39 protein n=1 Tax=Ilumatobacter sp. TaxID=1967498 RepID=UPI003B52C732